MRIGVGLGLYREPLLEIQAEVRKDGEPLSLVSWALSGPPTQDVGRGLARGTAQGHLSLSKAAESSYRAWSMKLFM